MWKTSITLLLISAVNATLSHTPAMGYIGWTGDSCWAQAGFMKLQADYLAHVGLSKLGYKYFIVDDCWQASSRSADGLMQSNPDRFPLGMKDMADHVHNAGLKFGLTLGSGIKTCQGYFGSLKNELVDAGSLWSWGVDYLRYNNCFGEGIPAKDRYTSMSWALNQTQPALYHPINIDMYYAINNLGDQGVSEWGPTIANSWTTNVQLNRGNVKQNAWQSVKHNFLSNMKNSHHSGPFHFNDPDHLLIGRGVLSNQEEETQFALWAISKAPLMITANITTMSFASQAILSNEYLISVNQDKLAQQANCTYNCAYNTAPTDSIQAFQAQIEETDTGGAYVVVVAVNWNDEQPASIAYNLQENGISFYPWDNCVVIDLYTGTSAKTNGGVQDWGIIPAHGNIAKKVKCLPF